MLSRVAENLYWMARYLERAENTARLINATTQALLDLPRGASFGWDVLVRVVGLERPYSEAYPRAEEASIMRFLVADERNPSSIVSCMRHARENCRTLREVLPRLAWERINSLYLSINRDAARAIERVRRMNTLDELVERRQSVKGLLHDCMSHDIAFHFIKLGEYLERADMTTRIVDISAAVLVARRQVPEDPAIGLLWVGVLKSLNAYQMYRRHGGAQVRGTGVVTYLIKDPHFPRSVHYCLEEIESCLVAFPMNAAALKLLRTAQRRVEGMRFDGLSPAQRHEYLDAIQADLAGIHEEISSGYFHRHEQSSALLAAAG